MPRKPTQKNPMIAYPGLEALEYFRAVAETGNSIAAAKRMGVHDPQYVAKIRRRMEERYGAQLFDMSTRPVKMTPAGKILYDHVVEVLTAYQNMNKKMDSLKAKLPQVTRIGLAATDWVIRDYKDRIAESISHAETKWGKVEFYKEFVCEDTTADTFLHPNKASVYASPMQDLPQLRGNPMIALFEEDWLPYVLRDSLSGPKEDMAYIGFTPGTDIAKSIRASIGDIGRCVVEMYDPVQVMNAVVCGVGVGFLPKRYAPPKDVARVVPNVSPIIVKFFGYTVR